MKIGTWDDSTNVCFAITKYEKPAQCSICVVYARVDRRFAFERGEDAKYMIWREIIALFYRQLNCVPP